MLTPDQKAAGVRALLAELRAWHRARLDLIGHAAGAREIAAHYEIPLPAALDGAGAVPDLPTLGAAVSEVAGWAECGAALFEDSSRPTAGASRGDDPAGRSASRPAGEPVEGAT